MKNSTKLELRKSEIRDELLDDSLGSEKRDALVDELRETESKWRAAVALEETETPDDDETDMSDLTSRIELRAYFEHALSEGSDPLKGAERELNAELRAGDQVIPWEAFVTDDAIEERADAVTDITTASRKTATNPLARIMARSDSAFMGIQTVTVPAGERQFVAMASGGSGKNFARNAPVESSAATFTTVDAKPTRGSIRYLWNLESTVTMPSMEQALRADAAATIRRYLDSQALVGDGSAPNPQGLLTGFAAPSDPSGVVTASALITDAISMVDGLIAHDTSNIRLLIGKETFQKIAGEQSTNKDFVLPKITARLGGVRVSTDIPAVASKKQAGLAYASGLVPASIFIPVWGPGPTVILDRYSNSASAQTALSLHYLYNVVTLRKEQYKRTIYQTAA